MHELYFPDLQISTRIPFLSTQHWEDLFRQVLKEASQRSYFSSASTHRAATMPRCVPKNVLWVEPVTRSTPSLNGSWKCGPTSPRTWAMSYMRTVARPAASRNCRISDTGSRWMIMLLPRITSSGGTAEDLEERRHVRLVGVPGDTGKAMTDGSSSVGRAPQSRAALPSAGRSGAHPC